VDLSEIYKEARRYCRDCEILSPMTCLEQCSIWKLKNELFELNQIVKRNMHVIDLLNAVKNRKRCKIIQILRRQSLTSDELQDHLKKEGFYHSLTTITNSYLKPILKAGIVKEESGRYRLTFYGRKIYVILSKEELQGMFPRGSNCYEEFCLLALGAGSKSFKELCSVVSQKALGRTIKRLEEKSLVTRNRPSGRVLYYKTNGKLDKFSPTERRVFDAISQSGMTVHDLTQKVGITIRRTYKYLKRLESKKLVVCQRRPTTYVLTPVGRRIANCLNEMIHLHESITSVMDHPLIDGQLP